MDGGVQLTIRTTLEALPILENVRGTINGFEVIQGTMDDVFLNAVDEKGE